MSDKLTIQDLKEGQKKVLESYEKLQKECPYELVGTLQKVVNVQKRILHELGYRKPVDKTKNAPPKDLFTNKESSSMLPVDKKDKEIKGDKPPKGLFKEKTVAETIGNDDVQVNKEVPPKGLFEEKEAVATKEEKANPKRLNPTQMAAIKALALEGFNIKQISDKLMIVEAKVSKHLGSKGKKSGGNLLATNAKDSNEKFQDEIKASKE